MTALFLAVLTAGFGGSLHCAAMCGPFAALSRHQLAYAAGRLGAYLALGVVAGAAGAALDLAGDLATFGKIAMPAAGVVVAAWGTWSLGRALGWVGGAAAVAHPSRPLLHAIRRRREVRGALLIGALTPLLPCGWLWAFVIVAAGTGAPLGGAAVMAALWLGSAPALLGAGVAFRAVARWLGPRLPVLTACLQIAVGVAALVIRAPIAPPAASPDATSVPAGPSCH